MLVASLMGQTGKSGKMENESNEWILGNGKSNQQMENPIFKHNFQFLNEFSHFEMEVLSNNMYVFKKV